jgi:hypothetical protein
MTFAWPEYLKVAEDLLKMRNHSAGDEAIVRATVSRAYYAAHRVAHDEIIGKRGIQPPQTAGGVHEQVIQALYTVKDAEWSKVGDELAILRRLRVHADYHLALPGEWGNSPDALRKKAIFEIARAGWLLKVIPALP